MHLITPLYAISGFVVGLLVGMTGVGGGSLMTPLLVLLFHIHPATAVGTDLLYAATTKSVGTLVHGVGRTVQWRIVLLLGSGSLPAVIGTLLWLRWLGSPDAATAKLISFVLGIALLLTAACMFFRPQIVAYAERHFANPTPRQAAIMTVITGILLGVFVTLSSVGAGAIGVTVLILLYPKLPLSRIVGTDIAHAVPLTFVAGVGHWLIGSVNWHLFGSLITGSIPGIIIGSLVATRVSERVLRPVLAAVLLLVGARLVF